MNNIIKELHKPFHPNDIEWRAGATNSQKDKALALAYITSRAVMDRLDEVCGAECWRDEYKEGPNGGVICGLSIKIGEEWITKWDGADNTNIEGVKGGLSDAFKRAGVKWGIGRYLYKLDGVWHSCKAYGNSVRLLEPLPTLPSWALPDEIIGEQKAEVKRIVGDDENFSLTKKPETKSTGNFTDEQIAKVEAVAGGLHFDGEQKATEKQRGFLAFLIDDVCGKKDAHHDVLFYLYGDMSVNKMRGADVRGFIDWLNPNKPEGATEWTVSNGKALVALWKYAETIQIVEF